ncbi:major facilitator superfamily domain-containing protein 8-like [Branchiostoma lanceolatum]|uniref:major facilitator superfamily domain-containing protein 8-like n=1 Tax=Branchiostoma lanceolatum TaxID=7740 RepID=UPI003454FA96
MELKTQKVLTNIGLGIWFFLAGVEYAVILPTAWLYVESLGGDRFFFGMVFSSFSAASLVFGIIFGIWADRVGKTKWIIIFANLWGIAGNTLYSVGTSKYLILVSRLITGAGSGVGSAIMAHLTLTTTNQERTKIFSFFIATRFIGIMVGPGFNFVLRLCDFYIGPIKIDAYTAPGVFIAALTVLLQIYMVFFLYDLPYIHEDADSKNPSTPTEDAQSSTNVSSNNLPSVAENLTVSQGTTSVENDQNSTSHVTQLHKSSENSRNLAASPGNQQSYESFHTCRSNVHSMTVESSEFYKTASFENLPNGDTEGHMNGFPSQPNGVVNNERQDSITEEEDGLTVRSSDGAIMEKVSNLL